MQAHAIILLELFYALTIIKDQNYRMFSPLSKQSRPE